MAGKQFTLKLHEDTTSSIVLDSVTIKDIDDTNLSVTTATVVKEDFPGIDTAWTVKVAYPSASIPAGTTTLNALKKVATDAINARREAAEHRQRESVLAEVAADERESLRR